LVVIINKMSKELAELLDINRTDMRHPEAEKARKELREAFEEKKRRDCEK